MTTTIVPAAGAAPTTAAGGEHRGSRSIDPRAASSMPRALFWTPPLIVDLGKCAFQAGSLTGCGAGLWSRPAFARSLPTTMSLTDDQIRALLRDPARFPPSAKLMGMELIDLSSKEGWAEFAFNPPPSFANPGGNVQGGFICGMLDDAMAIASSIAQGFKVVVPTLQMSVTFIASA
ncbi:MAG: PaaI family thioesterase, partial [Hyphomicrobiales bacterium]